MKKTMIALAVLAAGSTSVMAEDALSGEHFSVKAEAGIGGYYDSVSKELYDDWATGLTLKVSYENGNVIGYVEEDIEFNYSTAADGEQIEDGVNTDLDKAWVGYKTEAGVASYGYENDTALDKVDGAGDMTFELGSSAGDASDQFHVIKFQGKADVLAYGISTYTDEENTNRGYNGYVGAELEGTNIYVGYETNDSDWIVYTLSANTKAGSVDLGANVWHQGVDKDGFEKATGYYVSAGLAATEQVYLAAGYKGGEAKPDVDASALNVSATYQATSAVKLGTDVQYDIENEESKAFARATYKF